MALGVHLFLPQMRMSHDDIVARAVAAEAAGFEGIAFMDHLAPPMAAQHDMWEISSETHADAPSAMTAGPMGGGEEAMPNPNDPEAAVAVEPIRNFGNRVGRNDPCPCGSGKKFKNCCMKK